jgi:hypothetical protein
MPTGCPGGRGFEARPGLKALQISGHAPDTSEMQALRGCRLLSKPFGLEELAGTVRAILDATDTE